MAQTLRGDLTSDQEAHLIDLLAEKVCGDSFTETQSFIEGKGCAANFLVGRGEGCTTFSSCVSRNCSRICAPMTRLLSAERSHEISAMNMRYVGLNI